MRNCYYLLLCIVCLLPVAGIASPDFSFIKYEVDNGLSHNTVRCVIQDKTGFMWFGTGDGLNRFDGINYKIFHNDQQDTTSLRNNSIHSLYEDREGKIWVGTEKGIDIYDPQTGKFTPFRTQTPDEVIISSCVSVITTGPEHQIWIGTQGQGLLIYDSETQTLRQDSRLTSIVNSIFKTPNGKMYISTQSGEIAEFAPEQTLVYQLSKVVDETRITELTALYSCDDRIWYGEGGRGLHMLNLSNRQDRLLASATGNYSITYVRKIIPYSEQQLMIGTDNGLYLLNTNTASYHRIDDITDPQSLSDQSILDIYRDNEGGIWIATQYGGVNYLPRPLKHFDRYAPSYRAHTIQGKVISRFCEDRAGNIWIATEDNGLGYLDNSTGKITSYRPNNSPNSISDHNIQALLLDNTKLWIGTYSHGLDVMDLKTGTIKHYQHRRGYPNTIMDNGVTALYKDSRGNIYVGTAWGLSRYNPRTDSFIQESKTGNQSQICDILEDSRGNLWFATHNNGLYRYNPGKKEWTKYIYRENAPGHLCSNNVITLFEDNENRIWAGTETGLCSYDYTTDKFTTFDPDNTILPSQLVASIEQDQNGHFWLSSNAGLVCVDMQRKKIIGHFTKADGLQSNQFNFNASLRASNGKMYFGGINGFNIFQPEEFHHNNYIPRVVLTDLRINNQTVHAGEANSPLQLPLEKTQTIRLKYKQNTVEFRFAALSYQSPAKNQYAYILQNWDQDWIAVGNQSRASYSNLPPGKYVFRVKASNNDGKWNEEGASVRVTVLPPLYRSTTAYLLYILLLIGGIWLSLRLWARRLNQLHEQQMKEYAIEQEKNNYRSRIEFFTNLAHEIRTPLSLIKLPLECILKSNVGDAQTKNYLHMMEKNTASLLNLVNQLLDFRKTEEVGYTPHFRPCLISELLCDLSERFRAATDINGITLRLELPSHDVEANVDEEALVKIITNLLSNAVKYTHSQIKVRLIPNGKGFVLRISDDGPGVKPSEKKRIFDTFYQAEGSRAGTGIGLPLTKLLVEKHNGTITVEDTPETGGATFVVSIPPLKVEQGVPATPAPTIDLSQVILPEVHPTSIHLDTSQGSDSETLLLVDDNTELLNVMGSYLSRNYRILLATNGKEALDILDREGVDLIVTDLMMPEMDGYELCEFVKNDTRYCHIPIIQLTAKADLNDKLKGLEYGADAYIEKPFSMDHLCHQIQNLIDNRKRLRAVFNTTQEISEARAVATNKKDSEFIERLNEEVRKHLHEENFYIEELAESLFMSRSNFYRKIKSLFGMSPNEYLKNCRMKQAAHLLTNKDARISEIYVEVGFSSPSYFAKCFKNHFGVSPKEYASGKGRQ